MALYFNSDSTGPKIHILMIGVGAYRYLKGGFQQKEQEFDAAVELGQLGSPAVSVEALFEEFMSLHESGSWKIPLGTVDVLVSPTLDNGDIFKGRELEPANVKNIKAAYFNWKKRCNENEGNVAIFFFCGHGLDNGEQYLLTEDFGENPENPWDGSFAFDMTRRAFASCRAETQIFLVDACRQLSSDMLSSGIPMNPIDLPRSFNKECKYMLTQKAAAPNEAAYGVPGQPSFYTQALINALEGQAATTNKEGIWEIGTGKLASDMTDFLGQIAESQGYDQRCITNSTRNTALLTLSAPPNVPFTITCDPSHALGHATLSYFEMNTRVGDDRAPAENPWELNVSAGIYQLDANFAAGRYKKAFKFAHVFPPSRIEVLNCL